MTAHAMNMDAALDDALPPAPDAARARAASWSGVESAWVLAATAAAPWPVYWLLAWLGVPGEGAAPQVSHGVLALCVALAVMGLWTHRPSVRSGLRWSAAVVGTGLMGELLANALTDMGREDGLGAASDGARAIAVWAIAVAIYEVAPIVAASVRVSRVERRVPSLDLAAHGSFLLLAAGAYAWPPTWGSHWFVSPWLAAALASPLAAARSGPARDAALPPPRARGGRLLAVAALLWVMLVGYAAAIGEPIARSLHAMRWGATPLDAVLLALPATAGCLALLAAWICFTRALSVRRSASGTITAVGDGGVTIEVGEAPTTVAIGARPLPSPGTTVTLLGCSPRPADGGPFRDGAPQLEARRAWVGSPEGLARTLRERGAAWLGWAAVCAFGVLLRLA